MPRAAAVLCLLLLSGCLHPLEFPPVSLVGAAGDADAQGDALGVVPLADLRPREQKRGKVPWLIPLLIWNQRTGRYVTSSEHFGGDVSAEVSEAVANALSGWRFGRARVLEAEPGSQLAQHCQDGELDYVASGEIHHLYGAVRQRSWVFIIPSPWFFGWATGNQIGDPVGVVRMTLYIHECRTGEQIASRHFVSEGLFPRLSASGAAQRAFDAVLREIADLSRAPADAAPAAPARAASPDATADPEPPDAAMRPAEPEPEPAAPPEPAPVAEPAPEPPPRDKVLVPL